MNHRLPSYNRSGSDKVGRSDDTVDASQGGTTGAVEGSRIIHDHDLPSEQQRMIDACDNRPPSPSSSPSYTRSSITTASPSRVKSPDRRGGIRDDHDGQQNMDEDEKDHDRPPLKSSHGTTTRNKEESYEEVGDGGAQQEGQVFGLTAATNPSAATAAPAATQSTSDERTAKGGDTTKSTKQGNKDSMEGSDFDNVENALLLLQQSTSSNTTSARGGGGGAGTTTGDYELADEKGGRSSVDNQQRSFDSNEKVKNSRLDDDGLGVNYAKETDSMELSNTTKPTSSGSGMPSTSPTRLQTTQRSIQSSPRSASYPQSSSGPSHIPAPALNKNSFLTPPPLNTTSTEVSAPYSSSQFEPPPIQQLYHQQLIQQHHNIDYERGGDGGIYRDLSIYPDPAPDNRRNRGGVTVPFPEKLHQMLDYSEKNGLHEIVGFFPHGRAFAIHKPAQFVNNIMPKFFKQSRFTSFQRQVNLYGFRRLSQGPDSGGYYHELFLKGRPGLCINMKRTKVKGVTKSKNEPDTEPNFYNMPLIMSNKEANKRMERLIPTLAASAPPLANYGPSAHRRSAGTDMKKNDNYLMKSFPGNFQHDSSMIPGSTSLPPLDAAKSQISHSNRALGASASLEMMNKTNDMMWASRPLKDANQSFQPNSGQFSAAPGMYNQGALDLNNYANPMSMNDLSSHLTIPDAALNKPSTNMGYDHSNLLNSGLANQSMSLMHMNRNVDFSQHFKTNDNISNAMGILSQHGDGSHGLGSDSLTMNTSLTGQTPGTALGSQNPYFGQTSSLPLQGMNTNLMQGKEQASIPTFNSNFGMAGALNQNVSPVSNTILGQQAGFASGGIGSNMGMQAADYALHGTYGSGDLASQRKNYMSGYDLSNAPAAFSDMNNMNSRVQNLPSSGYNQMNSGGSTLSEQLQNLQYMQNNRASNAFPSSHQNIPGIAIAKNEANSSTMVGASQHNDQVFQNPFEYDATEGNNDSGQASGDPNSASNSIAKV